MSYPSHMVVPDYVHPLARAAWRGVAEHVTSDAPDWATACAWIARAIRPSYVGTFAPGQVGALTERETRERDARIAAANARRLAFARECDERQAAAQRRIHGGTWTGD